MNKLSNNENQLELSDLIMAINQCREEWHTISSHLENVSNQYPISSRDFNIALELRDQHSKILKECSRQISNALHPFVRQEELKTEQIFEQKNKDVK